MSEGHKFQDPPFYLHIFADTSAENSPIHLIILI